VDGGTTLAADRIEQSALDHVWLHATSWAEIADRRGLRVFARGDGARIYDIHGREYIDGMSGLWCVNAGHGRAEIADAMAAQEKQIAYVSADTYTSIPAIQLAETIADLLPGDMDRVFFCSGGSEAVESAIKIAKQVQFMRGFPKRYKIIARRGSYHGSTYGAMSLSGFRASERYFGPLMPGVFHVANPNTYRSQFPPLEGEADQIACANAVEQEILFQGPETVAAVIGETISSANGIHIPATAYWRRLRDICDKHGVLLICDEVINGWGRTGTWFAVEHYGIVPDMLTMAKGLSSGYAPIAAVAVRPSVFDGFRDEQQREVELAHLLTFGGHAGACAAALANIEIFKREDLVRQSAEKGVVLKEFADRLLSHPSVGDVRGGRGLICGVELVKDKVNKLNFDGAPDYGQRVSRLLADRGLITRVDRIIYLAPPFVITHDELERMIVIIDDALTQAEDEFAGQIVS
jgi:adenosylmethionine-8-amino-7-oxononanoate aminotransferase